MRTTRATRLALALGMLALLVGLPDLSMGKGAPPALPAAPGGNLEGHWKLDEGSGTTAADSTANSHDGTLSGGVAWVSGWGRSIKHHSSSSTQKREDVMSDGM